MPHPTTTGSSDNHTYWPQDEDMVSHVMTGRSMAVITERIQAHAQPVNCRATACVLPQRPQWRLLLGSLGQYSVCLSLSPQYSGQYSACLGQCSAGLSLSPHFHIIMTKKKKTKKKKKKRTSSSRHIIHSPTAVVKGCNTSIPGPVSLTCRAPASSAACLSRSRRCASRAAWSPARRASRADSFSRSCRSSSRSTSAALSCSNGN